MSMHNVLLLKKGPPAPKGQIKYDKIELTQRPIPKPKPTEVLVIILAAALNHRDVFIRQGLYPAIKDNSVLGSDCVGTVMLASMEPSLVGKRVILNPSMNWATNSSAPEKPTAHGILGLLPFAGTFGEYIAIDRRYVHVCPKHLSDSEAAALPLAGLTAFRALFTKAQVKLGQNVLISGIGGGVALLVLQYCVAISVNAYVTSSDDTKIERAIKMGAKGGVNYKKKEWIEELIKLAGGFDATGFDAAIDGAGGTENFSVFARVLKPGGIIANYGATAALSAEIVIPHFLFKHIELKACIIGNETEFAGMVRFVSQYKIKPIVSGVWEGLHNAEGAFEEIKNGNQFGKLVIRISKM